MKYCYVPKRFNAKGQETIQRVNDILDDYAAQGFDLTVRQIYYQFVSKEWIPNNLKAYKALAATINDARLAGLIDWNRIVDRTRFLRSVSTWDTPADIIDSAAASYKEDVWKDQKNRIEVWIEKDALVGVIETICQTNRVPFLSCRGYTSQSEMWGAAQRLNRYSEHMKTAQAVHIIHLGDHDPSGLDMTRDIEDRLVMFMDTAPTIHRIALNMPQVRAYKPPPNPAKITDSRAKAYIAEHGRESWELDALSPTVIAGLIQKEIDKLKDKKAWAESMEAEADNKSVLSDISGNYEDVAEYVRNL